MAPLIVKYGDLYGIPVHESRAFGPPSFMVLHPVLPGETIRRFMKERNESGYALERAKNRPDGWIYNADICNRILVELTWYIQKWERGSYEWDELDTAIRHMQDTMNEALPLYAREGHYDLAGSAMFRVIRNATFGTAENIYAAPMLSLWIKGGGA